LIYLADDGGLDADESGSFSAAVVDEGVGPEARKEAERGGGVRNRRKSLWVLTGAGTKRSAGRWPAAGGPDKWRGARGEPRGRPIGYGRSGWDQ
jgi:hypothetical protein